jgi:hypothetical protein
MIIYRTAELKKKLTNLPPPIPGIQKVAQMKILGVIMDDKLSFHLHAEKILSASAGKIYAIKSIKNKGLTGNALWDVTNATLVSQMLYASPVWWGFLDEMNKSRLLAILKKLSKTGLLSPSHQPFDILCEQADDNLFCSVLNNKNHVLHHLLPELKDTHYDLRPRAHNRTLPITENAQIKKKLY